MSHPRLRPNAPQPVRGGGNAPQVFLDVLLANPAHRHNPALGGGDADAEDALAQEDALGVVAQGAVAHVGDVRLALVEPVVDGEVVLGDAAIELRRADGVKGSLMFQHSPRFYFKFEPA